MSTPKNKITSASRRHTSSHLSVREELFEGPLPHPEVLGQYERISSGAAKRIISMAERQSHHRQALETKIVDSNIGNEKIGMWLAFTITMTLIIIGAILLMSDKNAIGLITIFVSCLFQAGNYIYQKYAEKKEPEEEKK
jgi:uncharacterized membrane protein